MVNKPKYPLPLEIQEQLDALESLPDDQINTSDVPEVKDWSKAVRGKFYRPLRTGGLWDQLSEDQKKAALEYDGPVGSGRKDLPAIKPKGQTDESTD